MTYAYASATFTFNATAAGLGAAMILSALPMTETMKARAIYSTAGVKWENCIFAESFDAESYNHTMFSFVCC